MSPKLKEKKMIKKPKSNDKSHGQSSQIKPQAKKGKKKKFNPK